MKREIRRQGRRAMVHQIAFGAACMLAHLTVANEGRASIYHKGWIDLNKNGRKDVYEDPSRPTETRIEDLIGRMTLEEKTCQLVTLYGFGRVLADELPTEEWKNAVWKDGIGNIDEHLNGVARHPNAETKLSYPHSRHAEAINTVQRFFVEETRLGIPVDFTNEGIRGLCHDRATSFPAQIGLGSSWNRQLVEAAGRITGREARVLGYTNVYAPILDLARDPRWGRTVECYGEDPYLVGQLGQAMVRGLQAERVVSTLKHFAVYSVPKGGRDGSFRTDPQVTPREMETIHLEPFRMAIQGAGALGVMSSYNDYDGVPITSSHEFLTETLRGRWGFRGYVVSDSGAVEFLATKHRTAADYLDAVRQCVEAGLNIRTNFTPPDGYLDALRQLVRSGRLPIDVVDDRVRDVLRVKFWLGLFDQPYVADPGIADQVVRSEAHLETAKRAAQESIVLLKNEDMTLPLRHDLKTILVTGPNATEVDNSIGRYGPSNLEVVSVLDGIRQRVSPRTQVYYTRGCDFVDVGFPESELTGAVPNRGEQAEIDRARELARIADAVILVLGENESLVGESRSRTSLELPGFQARLVQAVQSEGKPTVVVMLSGRPLTINWIDRHVPAVVQAWFQGEFCGTAIAEVLFGDYNPGGKLPVTFPKTVGQIPLNFPFKRGSQNPHALLQDDEKRTLVNGPLYAFGHGLSYTTFSYSDLEIAPAVAHAFEPIRISFEIENSGPRDGDEVAQLYLSHSVTSVTHYERVLRGFERVSLAAGEKRRLVFWLKPGDLALLNRDRFWAVEPGRLEVQIGSSSEDIRLRGSFDVRDGRILRSSLW